MCEKTTKQLRPKSGLYDVSNSKKFRDREKFTASAMYRKYL